MSDKTFLISQEGLDKLKDKLHDLKTRGRSEIALAISEAREKGDLRENAEYHAAKEEQGLQELEIARLETLIANARIVDQSALDTSKVSIFTMVKLKNLTNNATVKYTLVSENESNFKEGKISVDSPVGKGLLGKVIGDIAEIKVPAGTLRLEVLSIEPAVI